MKCAAVSRTFADPPANPTGRGQLVHTNLEFKGAPLVDFAHQPHRALPESQSPQQSPDLEPVSAHTSLPAHTLMIRPIALAITAAMLLCPCERANAQQDTSAAPVKRPRNTGDIRLTYLGNAGWEITDGVTVILVDPFLSQFARWDPSHPPAERTPNSLIAPDTARINKHITRADYILITHGHTDHALDAGYLSNRTGATIIGHETAANLARAYDVPEAKLITVIGGEDYKFGAFSLKVIPNIHSALDQKHYYNNGRGITGNAPRGLRAPLRVKDFVEGGNIAYLLRMAGHEVVIMGSMNYIEREMTGLRPDIVLVGANDQRREIYDFTGRLMRALGQPAIAIPTHADSYGNPNPLPAAVASNQRFVAEVAAASPRTRVIRPVWFTPIVIPARKCTPTTRASGCRGASR